MEPWQSWTAAILVTGGLTWYYTRGKNVQSKVTRATQAFEQPQASPGSRRREKASTRNKAVIPKIVEQVKDAASATVDATTSALTDATKPSKKRKAAKQSNQAQQPKPSTVKEALAPIVDPVESDDEPELDDKEWARQLDAKKKGISLSTPSGPSSTKTKVAAGKNDDKSVKSSGNVRASAGKDVSDMLEPAAAGPSILRVTGEVKEKKHSAAKAAPAQETKKQRQNKRKAEEQRLAREADEKERKVLQEKQRKTAREARGEPAKNGLADAAAPSTSAWTASQTSSAHADGSVAAGSEAGNVIPLLDTFDHDAASSASSNDIPTNVTTPATNASVVDQELPSEVAQLETLGETDGWNEVPKGRKGKKKAAVEAPSEDITAKENHGNQRTVQAPAPPKAKEPSVSNGYVYEDPPDYIRPRPGHPDDSEWL